MLIFVVHIQSKLLLINLLTIDLVNSYYVCKPVFAEKAKENAIT